MPRYQRTEFQEEERRYSGGSDDDNNSTTTTTLDGTVIFPPDITKGFANPNTDFDVVFKSCDVGLGSTTEHDVLATGSPIHPMVNIQRPSSKGSNTTRRNGSSLRFFKGKLLRPFGYVFPSRGSGDVSSSSSSRRASFLWSRMTLLEKILFLLCVVLSVSVVMLMIALMKRSPQNLIPYYSSTVTSSKTSQSKGRYLTIFWDPAKKSVLSITITLTLPLLHFVVQNTAWLQHVLRLPRQLLMPWIHR